MEQFVQQHPRLAALIILALCAVHVWPFVRGPLRFWWRTRHWRCVECGCRARFIRAGRRLCMDCVDAEEATQRDFVATARSDIAGQDVVAVLGPCGFQFIGKEEAPQKVAVARVRPKGAMT